MNMNRNTLADFILSNAAGGHSDEPDYTPEMRARMKKHAIEKSRLVPRTNDKGRSRKSRTFAEHTRGER